MSILIKGMEMPKGCSRCPCWAYGECNAVVPPKHLSMNYRWFVIERPDWCPLVTVPEKHGRLKDADALKRELMVSGIIDHYGTQINIKIDSAPTVIEAEGGGEDG